MRARARLRSNPSNCVVRPPVPDDFRRMADLAGQLGYPCTEQQVRERAEEMANSREQAVFVAERPGEGVAGWIGVFIFRAVELEKCAEISGLIVDEAARSQGVGKALLDAAEAWARSAGCEAISVHSNIKRQRAHGFYMRNGYAWVKTQEFLRKDLSA
jgi:GNAT superfamily N-acetyltransferase